MKKKCVVCGLECDGQPRYKDEQDQYLHVSCAEPQIAEGAAQTQSMGMAGTPGEATTSSIRLWNPNVASCLSLLFSPAFGAWVHAVNWRSLGENDKARQSMKWVWGIFIFILVDLMIDLSGQSFSIPLITHLIVLLLWYFCFGKSQIKHVKAKQTVYTKKSWVRPVGYWFLGWVSIFIFAIVATLLSIVMGVNDLNGNQESSQGNHVEWIGKKAPDFSLETLDGDLVSLHELQGKSVVLDIWATWCPPCRAEIPHFIELRNAYPISELAILGVSREKRTIVESFARKMEVNYPMAVSEDLPAPFGEVSAIPTTFFIDEKGYIKEVFQGYRDYETLRDAVVAVDGDEIE
ncbi:TlpA family protein disulfide reductase [bacterium]|nr:TlpA family protein disulfide reductase [bacterium]